MEVEAADVEVGALGVGVEGPDVEELEGEDVQVGALRWEWKKVRKWES